MARIWSAFLALALALTFVVLGAPTTASASPDLEGRWVTDSKRDGGFGYSMTLTSSTRQASDYTGVLWFSYPDGRIGSSVRVTATDKGNRLVIKSQGGSFDRSGRTLRAEVDRRTGVVTFINCQQRLRLVMSWALDSDCVLRR